jgi:hypothetical protein
MRLLISCVFVATTAMPLMADDANWEKVSSSDGKFTAEFPAKPRTMPGGNARQIQIVLETSGGKHTYMVQSNSIENAIPIDNQEAVKTVFDGGESGLTKALKGKIVSSKDTTFSDQKYPARDIDMEVAAFGIYRVRLVLTGQRLYQITVLGPKDFVDGKDVEKFMNSFKIEK